MKEWKEVLSKKNLILLEIHSWNRPCCDRHCLASVIETFEAIARMRFGLLHENEKVLSFAMSVSERGWVSWA